MTQRQKVHFFGKIAIFSAFLFCIFQAIFFVTGSQYTILIQKETLTTSPKTELLSAYSSQASGGALAISTRIGIGSYDKENTNQIGGWYIYQSGEDLSHDFIPENLLHVREYLNFSRINVKQTLDQSSNKEKTLSSLISGFSKRAENAKISINSLEQRKSETLQKLTQTQSTIAQIKNTMEMSFSNGEGDTTLRQIEIYYGEREKYTRYFTHIVFINQFLAQYNFLIDYNTNMLQTLKLNKNALIDGDYIIIPSSGEEYLRQLELLFNEGEI